jgi:hypothetical protein
MLIYGKHNWAYDEVMESQKNIEVLQYEVSYLKSKIDKICESYLSGSLKI